MSKKRTGSLGRAIDRVARGFERAFTAKDDAAFYRAIDSLEELGEEDHSHDEEEPDTIEVHNHIPGQTDGLGELPGKEGGEKQFDEEMPPWAKKMNDALEGLQKWAEEEKKEKAHSGDRRDRRNRDDEEEREEEHQEDRRDRRNRDDEEENLEMMDRGRHHDESEEEREEERSEDRRDRRDMHNDEANKEILGELEYEAPPGTGVKDARRARDSRYLEDAFQDCLSRAEVLAPGISAPTFDRKASPSKTIRSMARLRGKALDLAYNQTPTRNIIDGCMSGRTMDSKRMPLGHLRVLFNAVATAAEGLNNSRATDRQGEFTTQRRTRDSTQSHEVGGRIQSIADMNKANREFPKWTSRTR